MLYYLSQNDVIAICVKEGHLEKDISASQEEAEEYSWLQEENENEGWKGFDKQEKGKGEEPDLGGLS